MMITKKENILRTINRKNPEWVPYRYDSTLDLFPNILTRAINGGLDDWGASWIPTNSPEGSFPDKIPPLTIDQVSEYKVPETDFEMIKNNLREKIEETTRKDVLLIVKNELIYFERAKALLGMEETLVSMIFNKS